MKTRSNIIKITGKSILSFAVFVFGLMQYIQAQTPVFHWADGMSSTIGSSGKAVEIDASGNVYTCGFFYGTCDFDPGSAVFNLTSSGNNDIFVSKVDASGNFVWAKSVGGTGFDRGNAMALDQSGNVYITGAFQSAVDFDPGAATFNLSSAGMYDIFILKLNASGNFVWAKSMGVTGYDDWGNAISTDATGNVYTGGYFEGTIDLDPGAGTYNLISAGLRDAFISKLDASGNFVWAVAMGGIYYESVNGLAIDPSGNVYTTGYFQWDADFDPGVGSFSLSAVSQYDAFVSKLNASGSFVWAKRFGGPTDEIGSCITTDGSGNVFTTGYFENSCDFDPGAGIFNLTSAGQQDVFVSKLSASGNFLWAKSMEGPSFDYGNTIKTDAAGNVYTYGSFEGTVDFDPSASSTFIRTSAGNSDIFISKLDGSGSFVWAMSIGGTNDDYGYDLTTDAANNVYVTGIFDGTVDLDPGTGIHNLVSGASYDAFILKLGNCIAPAPPTDATPAANKNICQNLSTSLMASGSGTINWYDNATATLPIGSGNSLLTPTLSAGTATFFAETFSCIASTSRAAIVVTVSTSLGLEDRASNISSSLLVYPNPFNTSVTFDMLTVPSVDVELNIYNLFGQKVRTITHIRGSKLTFDREDLTAGIYFYELTGTSETIESGKIIVKD